MNTGFSSANAGVLSFRRNKAANRLKMATGGNMPTLIDK
jgi:hypothetical protein